MTYIYIYTYTYFMDSEAENLCVYIFICIRMYLHVSTRKYRITLYLAAMTAMILDWASARVVAHGLSNIPCLSSGPDVELLFIIPDVRCPVVWAIHLSLPFATVEKKRRPVQQAGAIRGCQQFPSRNSRPSHSFVLTCWCFNVAGVLKLKHFSPALLGNREYEALDEALHEDRFTRSHQHSPAARALCHVT